MSERKDDTPEPPGARHPQDAPRGSYYYDDATNYQPYIPDEDESDEDENGESDDEAHRAARDDTRAPPPTR